MFTKPTFSNFDSYIVHYHFEGSYTASGDGDVNEGNLDSVILAHEHDMGVL